MRLVKKRGAVGIGTLIVFIAMVLVAAVAAAVLINTSGYLQQKASSTGRETTQEVASGIKVTKVIGYNPATPPSSGRIEKLAIYVSPNAGSAGIDMRKVRVVLSDGSKQAIYSYFVGDFVDPQDGVKLDDDENFDETSETDQDPITIKDQLKITYSSGQSGDQLIINDGSSDLTIDLTNDGTGTLYADHDVTIVALDSSNNIIGSLVLDKGENTIVVEVTKDGDTITGVTIYNKKYPTHKIAKQDSSGVSTVIDTTTISLLGAAFTKFDDLTGGIFGETNPAWAALRSSTDFGIIVLQDSDKSFDDRGEYPTLNKGDIAVITLDVESVFGGFSPRQRIQGKIIPEFGAPGVIEFTTPSSFNSNIIELQ